MGPQWVWSFEIATTLHGSTILDLRIPRRSRLALVVVSALTLASKLANHRTHGDSSCGQGWVYESLVTVAVLLASSHARKLLQYLAIVQSHNNTARFCVQDNTLKAAFMYRTSFNPTCYE
jgi:uncharacterized membrane protein AbrB (regulator of aidB expression)